MSTFGDTVRNAKETIVGNRGKVISALAKAKDKVKGEGFGIERSVNEGYKSGGFTKNHITEIKAGPLGSVKIPGKIEWKRQKPVYKTIPEEKASNKKILQVEKLKEWKPKPQSDGIGVGP